MQVVLGHEDGGEQTNCSPPFEYLALDTSLSYKRQKGDTSDIANTSLYQYTRCNEASNGNVR